MADANIDVTITGRDNLSKELKSIESNVIRFVGAISSALTALTAIGFPVVSAANFQKELLAAAKTTQYTREEIDELRIGLSELSKQTNVTAVDLAKIATMGGQIGLGGEGNVQELVAFTASIATAVSSLDISAEDAVESMGKLINIFNIAPQEFDKAVSALTAVSVASTADAQKLFDVVRRIGNLGGSVTLPQAAALSGSLIDLGLTAETAGTTITKIFADMKSNAQGFANVALKGNLTAEKSIEDLRYTTEEWINLVATDGVAAINAYVTGLNNMGQVQAAQTKSALTGEGRLFEAVTKIQQQRARQTAIERQIFAVEQNILRLKETSSEATSAQLKAEEARLVALKRTYTQVSVVDRLAKTAADAFAAGDEGAKAQQTVLAGLIAQFDVFTNHVIAAANAIGGAFLPPLTELLRSFSKSMEASNAEGELRAAANGIVEVLREIGDAIAYVKTYFGKGTGFDWGSLLNAVALVGGVTAIKSLIHIIGVLSKSALTAVPGVTTLTNALLGTKKAAESATSTGRTGGLFSKLADGAKEAALRYSEAAKKLGQDSTFAANKAQYLQRRMDGATQAANAYASRFGNIANAYLRLATQQAQLATATGRTASGLKTQIAYTQSVIDGYNGAASASARFATQLARVVAWQAQLSTQRPSSTLPILPTISDGFAKFKEAGKKAVAAFTTGFAQGGLAGGLQAAMAPISAALSNAFSSAKTAGVSGFWASVTAGTNAAGAALGNYLIKLVGLEAAWAAATTAGTKFFTATIAGFFLLGKAISLVGTVIGAAFRLFFAALVIIEVLKMIGVFEKLKSVIQSIAEWFGFDKQDLPAFLQTKEDAENTTIAIEKLAEAYKKLREEAAKFNEERKATLGAARVPEIAKDDLTYKPDAPDAAAKNALDYFNALTAAYAEATVKKQALVTAEKSLIAATADAEKKQKTYADGVNKASVEVAALEKAQARYDRILNKQGATALQVERAERDLANAKKEYERSNIRNVNAPSRQYQAAAAEVRRLQEAIEGLNKAIEDTGGDVENPYAGIDAAMKNYVQTVFSLEEAITILGHAQENDIPLLRQYGDALAQQNARAEDLAAATKNLEALKPAEGQSVDLVAQQKYTEQIAAASNELDKQKRVLSTVREEILKGSRSREEMAKFLDNLGNIKSPANLLLTVNGIVQAAKSLPAELFSGANLPKIKGEDLLSNAATVAFATRAKEMYQAFSKYASEEAERAKNYINQARGEMEKGLKAAAAFAEKISQAQANNVNKAKNQRADRADEASSRAYLARIKTQQDIERSLLEQTFGIQQRNLAELEQGGINVFTQKAEAYAYEQQALFELEERYRTLTDLEQDRLNLQKQRRQATDEVAQFDKLIKRVEYYKKLVTEANATINNPRANVQDQYAALTRRNEALDKMRGIYTQLEGSAERLSSMDPIGGQLVANPGDLERMSKSITEVAGTIGKLNLESAGNISSVYEKVAQTTAGIAKGYETQADLAANAFVRIATASDRAGESVASLANRYANIVANAPQFASAMEKLQSVLQNGLASPGAIDTKELDKLSEAFVGAVSKIKDTKVPVQLDTAGIADQISTAILKGTTFASQAKPIAAAFPVQPTVDPEAMTKLQKDIAAQQAAGGKVFVDVGLKATDIDLSQVEGKLNIAFNVTTKARGGLIGAVVGAGEGLTSLIPRFAAGGSPGKVTGRGTGTSDSILSWLSNGEYVIDALTTSRFGSKFFATLQKMARGGKSGAFLTKLALPKFATGGPVGLPAELMKQFETDFKSDSITKRDVVDINISDGKRTATIQAEREQARSLIGILRNFER